MIQQFQRLVRLRGLTTVCVMVLCWVLAGFALADPDLSAKADLGGAKALFVALAVLMTLLAIYKIRLFGGRD